MIRLALRFVLSAAVMAPAAHNASTTTTSAVRDSKANHQTTAQHAVTRSGYIIASS